MNRTVPLLRTGAFLFSLSVLGLQQGSKVTIVCFGDSITHGARVNGHSWVSILAKEHKEIEFVNEGRNGRKTSDREEMIPVLKMHKDADYFLVFLGVNDLKDGNDSMVSRCVRNVRWMIGQIRRASPESRIIILSPVQINLKRMSPLNVKKKYNENTERSLVTLDTEYRLLARSESVGFISLLDAVSPPNYVDGLHPDEAGQQEIASTVWKGLSRLLRRPAG